MLHHSTSCSQRPCQSATPKRHGLANRRVGTEVTVSSQANVQARKLQDVLASCHVDVGGGDTRQGLAAW